LEISDLFDDARTYGEFEDKAVPAALLLRLYNHLKWGPTSANSCPARFVFITSPDAKARLLPCVNGGNVDTVLSAPVTVIVAGDTRFYDLMPQLYPARDFKTLFENNEAAVQDLTARNVPLQGAYMIIVARALGLDCGPMSGFDAAKIDTEFFPDGRWRSNFICTLGYGVRAALHPRNPRLAFDAACLVI
jgi:3-hydroxypropanoate dehydrogenase